MTRLRRILWRQPGGPGLTTIAEVGLALAPPARSAEPEDAQDHGSHPPADTARPNNDWRRDPWLHIVAGVDVFNSDRIGPEAERPALLPVGPDPQSAIGRADEPSASRPSLSPNSLVVDSMDTPAPSRSLPSWPSDEPWPPRPPSPEHLRSSATAVPSLPVQAGDAVETPTSELAFAGGGVVGTNESATGALSVPLAVAGPLQTTDLPAATSLLGELTSPAAKRLVATMLLVLISITAFRWTRILQTPGFGWNDDVALHLRQAQALAEGTPQQAVADNAFTVASSGAALPNAHPWGWAILASPLLALSPYPNGLRLVNVAAAVFFVASLIGLFVLMRRRTGNLASVAVVAATASSLGVLRTVATPDGTAAFGASVVLALLALDSYRRNGAHRSPRHGAAVMVGVALAWCATVRRDGLGLLVGLVVLHVVESLLWLNEARSEGRVTLTSLRRGARRGLLPYGVFLVSAAVFQLALPATLLPGGWSLSPARIEAAARSYRVAFDAVVSPGNGGGGFHRLVLAVALVGLIGRGVRAFRDDLWLAAAMAGCLLLVSVGEPNDVRLLSVLLPWVFYFVVQAFGSVAAFIPKLSGRVSRRGDVSSGRIRKFDGERRSARARGASRGRRRSFNVELAGRSTSEIPGHSAEPARWGGRSSLAGGAFVVVLLALGFGTTRTELQAQRRASPAGSAHSEADRQLFDAVQRFVARNDVVAFDHPQVLTLETGRRSVGPSAAADWHVTSALTVLPPTAKVAWSDKRFVLWKAGTAPKGSDPEVRTVDGRVPTRAPAVTTAQDGS